MFKWFFTQLCDLRSCNGNDNKDEKGSTLVKDRYISRSLMQTFVLSSVFILNYVTDNFGKPTVKTFCVVCRREHRNQSIVCNNPIDLSIYTAA